METKAPVNPVIQVGDTLYFGGIPATNNEGVLLGDDLKTQFEVIIKKITSYLNICQMDLGNLAFVTVYLTNLINYEKLNQIYRELIPQPYPARKVIITPLALPGSLIEISGIASKKPKQIINL